MAELDLDAIEADIRRHASAIGPGGDKAWYAAQLAREVPALVAEVRRLRAYAETTRHHQQQHAEAVREVERLRAEVAKVRTDRDEEAALASRFRPVVEAAQKWAEALTGPVEPKPEAEALYRAVQALPNTQEPCGICSGYGCPDCREDGA